MAAESVLSGIVERHNLGQKAEFSVAGGLVIMISTLQTVAHEWIHGTVAAGFGIPVESFGFHLGGFMGGYAFVKLGENIMGTWQYLAVLLTPNVFDIAFASSMLIAGCKNYWRHAQQGEKYVRAEDMMMPIYGAMYVGSHFLISQFAKFPESASTALDFIRLGGDYGLAAVNHILLMTQAGLLDPNVVTLGQVERYTALFGLATIALGLLAERGFNIAYRHANLTNSHSPLTIGCGKIRR